MISGNAKANPYWPAISVGDECSLAVASDPPSFHGADELASDCQSFSLPAGQILKKGTDRDYFQRSSVRQSFNLEILEGIEFHLGWYIASGREAETARENGGRTDPPALAAETVGFCSGVLYLPKLHGVNSSRRMEQKGRGPDSLTVAQSGRVVVIAVGSAQDGDVFGDDQVASDHELLPVGGLQMRKEIANRFLGAHVMRENYSGRSHKECERSLHREPRLQV